MRRYISTPRKRHYNAERIVARYWADPAFRLECINRDRAKRGRPLHTSIDEVQAGWAQRPWADKGVERK